MLDRGSVDRAPAADPLAGGSVLTEPVRRLGGVMLDATGDVGDVTLFGLRAVGSFWRSGPRSELCYPACTRSG